MAFKALNWIKNHKICVGLASVITFGYYLALVKIDLPSDEKIIGHFYAHRADIEELVRRYRAYENPEGYRGSAGEPHADWIKQEDTETLLQKTGVSWIRPIGEELWLPEPYTNEAQRARYAHTGDRSFQLAYRYSLLEVQLTPRERYLTSHFIYGPVWKELIYFPEPPEIEYGYLLSPSVFKHRHSDMPLATSLNRLPLDWWCTHNCVYRQIEPQWFLMMCNGR